MKTGKSKRRMTKLTMLICLLVTLVTALTYGLISLLSQQAILTQEVSSLSTYHDRISANLDEALVSRGNNTLVQLSKNIPVGGIGRMQYDMGALHDLYQDVLILTRSYPDIHSVYFVSGIDAKAYYYSQTGNGIQELERFFEPELYERHLAAQEYTLLTPVRQVNLGDMSRNESLRESTPFFTISIRLPFRKRSEDVMVINLKESFFENPLGASNLPKDSVYFLVDGEGSVIYSYANGEKGNLAAEDTRAILGDDWYAQGSNIEKFSLSQGKYHLFSSQQKNGRYYFLAVPSKAIGSGYSLFNGRVLLLQLVILVMGLLLAVFLASTISRPLLGLLDRLRGERSEPSGAIRYPLFHVIGQEIDEIVDLAKQRKETMDHYFRIYKQSSLLSLLRGDMAHQDSYKSLEEPYKECDIFQVLLVKGMETDGLTSQLHNCMADRGIMETTILPDGHMAFLLGYKPGLAPGEEELRSKLNDIRMLSANEGIKIAAGPPTQEMENISASYYGALGLLASHNEQDGAVLLYSDDMPPGHDGRIVLGKLQEEICRAMEFATIPLLEKRVSVFFQVMAQMRYPLARQRRQCSYLLYEIALLPRWENVIGAEETMCRQFYDAGDERQLQERLMGQLQGLWEASSEEAGGGEAAAEIDSGKVGLIEQVQLYVREHYHEDISLNQIADYLYFTPQYLGKLFRDITGITFTSYLVQVRMQAAEELLIDTKKSIAKIAEATGYSTVQSFGRVFKSYRGCTPGEYRRMNGSSRLSE